MSHQSRQGRRGFGPERDRQGGLVTARGIQTCVQLSLVQTRQCLSLLSFCGERRMHRRCVRWPGFVPLTLTDHAKTPLRASPIGHVTQLVHPVLHNCGRCCARPLLQHPFCLVRKDDVLEPGSVFPFMVPSMVNFHFFNGTGAVETATCLSVPSLSGGSKLTAWPPCSVEEVVSPSIGESHRSRAKNALEKHDWLHHC